MMEKLNYRFNHLLAAAGKADPASLTSQLVDLILEEAVGANASDIHIEPLDGKTRIRYRIDGRLYEVLFIDDTLKIPVITRIEIMSGLQTDAMTKRKSQDGRFTAKVGVSNFDFRVATFPTVRGEKMAIRILNEDIGLYDFAKIGLDTADQLRIDKILQHKNGLVLVCGPTGSGKTTTLYAILNRINSPRMNIVTLEDPVEYKILGMNQCDIKTRSDFKFADGLKAVLRQDPDIILVGEIRDKETADIAIRGAMTGHLVFSTLHTNSAIGTIVRLMNMGLETFMVSYAMVGAVSQRLVRQICSQCKVQVPVKPDLLQYLKSHKLLGPGVAKAAPESLTFYKGEGCDFCHQTGYRGRVGVYEIILFDEDLREAILRGASADELEQIAVNKGMKLLAQDGFEKVKQGLTTLDEIYSVLLDE